MKCHCNEVEELRKQRDEANSRTLRMWERARIAEVKLAKIEALAVQYHVVDEGPDAMGFSTLVRTPFVRKAELDAILGDGNA